MIDTIFVRARVVARLQQNPLSPYLEQFATVLSGQGYASSSIQDSLRAGDKLGRWLQQQGHNTAQIDEALLESYVNGLERYRSGNRCKAAAGLTHLFQLLRQQGVVIKPQT